jgi:hypothetical protein
MASIANSSRGKLGLYILTGSVTTLMLSFFSIWIAVLKANTSNFHNQYWNSCSQCNIAWVEWKSFFSDAVTLSSHYAEWIPGLGIPVLNGRTPVAFRGSTPFNSTKWFASWRKYNSNNTMFIVDTGLPLRWCQVVVQRDSRMRLGSANVAMFVINALSLGLAIGSIRWIIRRVNNLVKRLRFGSDYCHHCNYHLTSSLGAVCPECGYAIRAGS